jgi:hypothetical protein
VGAVPHADSLEKGGIHRGKGDPSYPLSRLELQRWSNCPAGLSFPVEVSSRSVANPGFLLLSLRDGTEGEGGVLEFGDGRRARKGEILLEAG